MRNLYLVLFILWSLVCWWYYTCQIKNACWGDTSSTTTTIPNTSADQPLLFRWSSFNIPLDSSFPSLKESILTAKEDGKVLEITGYQFPDEVNYDTQYELGIARASEVKKLLVEYIPEERIRVFSATLPTNEVPTDSLIQGIQFEWVIDETNLSEDEEESDKEAIDPIEEEATTPTASTTNVPSSSSDVYSSNSFVKYFPYNKTAIPAELTTFLDDLAARLLAENKKVVIRGHTDSAGDKETNFKVGLRRAKKVRDQLKNRGVAHKQIKTTSDGEKNPIADNTTEEGRQLNRRIEIFVQE